MLKKSFLKIPSWVFHTENIWFGIWCFMDLESILKRICFWISSNRQSWSFFRFFWTVSFGKTCIFLHRVRKQIFLQLIDQVAIKFLHCNRILNDNPVRVICITIGCYVFLKLFSLFWKLFKLNMTWNHVNPYWLTVKIKQEKSL